jgi:hypothetical protein
MNCMAFSLAWRPGHNQGLKPDSFPRIGGTAKSHALIDTGPLPVKHSVIKL